MLVDNENGHLKVSILQFRPQPLWRKGLRAIALGYFPQNIEIQQGEKYGIPEIAATVERLYRS